MKIRIELETTEAETFSALEKLEYFGDRIREAAALFQGKIIESMSEEFDWPPPVEEPWPDRSPSDEIEEDEEEQEDEDDDDYHVYDDNDEDIESEEVADSQQDVRFSRPIDLSELAAANTAPMWSTLSLSAASSAYEEEDKAAATPTYLAKEQAPQPVSTQNPSHLNLPRLGEEVRYESTEIFFDLVATWSQNFGVEGPQPDRLEELRKIGSGRWALPILVMCFELGSLQRLVEKALIHRHLCDPEHAGQTETEQAVTRQNRLELADRIAANMVQVSHLVFPDLAGTYDYSTKWRRG